MITDEIAQDFWSDCLTCDPEAGQTTPQAVHEAACRLVAAGLSVIPIADDGSKAPDWQRLPRYWDEHENRSKPSWKIFQVRRPSDEEIASWFADGHTFGIAVVAGQVSGGQRNCGLEIIDFDTFDLFGTWAEQVERQAKGLVSRLVQVQSPRPGRHLYYLCTEFAGNQKLASAPIEDADGSATSDGTPQRPKKTTLIELKGEGGYCLVPPSPRWCHPSGRRYVLAKGSPDLTQIPLITPAERTLLLDAARSFDRWIEPERVVPVQSGVQGKRSQQKDEGGSSRPGDDFNQRADWSEILCSHGWVPTGTSGGKTLWRRPGKDTGCSATTGHCKSDEEGELLFVFSSNAEPFEEGRPYSKFAAYALLEHDGDFKAAAGELRQQGYGGVTSNAR